MDNRQDTGGGAGSMMRRVGILVGGACLTVLLSGCPGISDPGDRPAAGQSAPARSGAAHPYVGMWVTADGHIRQQLLADGRYDEARGERDSAYTGSYRVSGNRIDYVDDTGFTADGTFEQDTLHHGGYTFYREGSDDHRRAVDDLKGASG
jgi:hypothetical protein